MRLGVLFSLVLHAAIVGVGFVSWHSGWLPEVEAEPYVPIELIAEAELDLTTSVPAAAPEPEEEVIAEPERAEETEPEEVFIEEAEPQEPAQPDPVEAEPAPAPDPEAGEEAETAPPPTAPQPKPKKEPEELDLAALSKLIDKEKERTDAPGQAPSQTGEVADRARPAIGAGDRLTASDEAKMRAAVEQCWNASAIIGAPEPETLIVVVEIDLDRDGSLIGAPRVANGLQINLSGNRFWKVAEQTAVRAVVSCAPYDFLPQDRYESWKGFTLNFDPSKMVGR